MMMCMQRLSKALTKKSRAYKPLYHFALCLRNFVMPRKSFLKAMSFCANEKVFVSLYVPEEKTWHMLLKGNPKYKISLAMTENTVIQSDIPIKTDCYGDLHFSAEEYERFICGVSVIESMFGTRIKKIKGLWTTSESKNRTADECAQRVLRHLLEQTGSPNQIKYKVDSKKKFSQAISRFDRRMSSLESQKRFASAVPKLDIKSSETKRLKKVLTITEEVMKEKRDKIILHYSDLIKDARAKSLEDYKMQLKRWEDFKDENIKADRYECFRELQLKFDMDYWNRLKVENDWILRASYEDLKKERERIIKALARQEKIWLEYAREHMKEEKATMKRHHYIYFKRTHEHPINQERLRLKELEKKLDKRETAVLFREVEPLKDKKEELVAEFLEKFRKSNADSADDYMVRDW